jgi:hypothetical protein
MNNNVQVINEDDSTIMYELKKKVTPRVHTALITNDAWNVDVWNPANEVSKQVIESTGRLFTANTLDGINIIRLPPNIENRRSQFLLKQQQKNQKISENSTDTLNSLNIDQWIAKMDFDSFTQLRKFKTWKTIPSCLRKEWCVLVKMVLAKITQATTKEDRSKYLKVFLVLPHMFLPVRSSTRQILQHVMNQNPFTVEFSNRTSDGNHQHHNNTNNNNLASRVGRRVENLAKEQNISGAVKLLLQNAEKTPEENQRNPDEVFEETVNNLKTKFPNRLEENNFTPVNHRVTAIDRSLVIKVVKKLAKNSATSIDGWTRDLLFQAICVDSSIAEDLGLVLSMIASCTQTENKENEQNIHNNENKRNKQQKQLQKQQNQQYKQQQKQNNNNNNNSNGGFNDDDNLSLDDLFSSNNNNNTNNQQQQQIPQNEEQEHEFFDNDTMKIIRAARLVGIPKSDGGTRPIIISSFLSKITGACLMKRSGCTRIPSQYAIFYNNGAKVVGHIARTQFQQGKAIICLDIHNCFNTTVRKNVLKQMQEDKICDDLQSYFCVLYQYSSPLIVYGPSGKISIIDSDEGLRQGEALSSYATALVLRKVSDLIKEKYPHDDACAPFLYMDDFTIICDPSLVYEVVNLAIECAEQCGFKINKEKSCVICISDILNNNNNEDSPFKELPIPIHNPNKFLKVLGINITNNFKEFNDIIIERIDRFFDSLDEIHVHPEIKHMILHFCGRGRLQYYCETTPPQFGVDVVTHFQQKMKSSFGKIVGVDDVDSIKDEMLYNQNGGNLPNYAQHHEEIYNKMVTFVELRSGGDSGGLQEPFSVELISSSKELFTSLECSHDRQWTHYLSPSNVIQLTPLQYRNALAFRMKLIPSIYLKQIGEDFIKCECDLQPLMCIKNLTTEEEKELEKSNQFVPFLQHIVKCHVMHRMNETPRHELVKHAIRRIAQMYGFTTTNEPDFYLYSDKKNKRPDLTFSIPSQRPKIVIDVTVVQPHVKSNEDVVFVGRAAAEAANNKIEKHESAAELQGHRFIPFALETTGYFDRAAKEFINILRNTLPFSSRQNFTRDMYGAVSTALAEYRAEILTLTLTKARTRN